MVIAKRDGEFMHIMSTGEHIQLLDKAFNKVNVKYLGWALETPPMCVANIGKLIQSPEDFKGMKIRAPGASSKLVQAFGGQGVSMPRPEVYMAIQQKVIDGSYTSLSSIRTDLLWEVAQYCTELGNWGGPQLAVMNLELWNSLPADVKKAFEKVGSEMTDQATKVWAKYNMETRDVLKSKFKDMYFVKPGPIADAYAQLITTKVREPEIAKMNAESKAWYEMIMKTQKDENAKGW
jgi:TRAP-type C4-dicarboxylate transport system substrate-binding protein